MGAEVGHPITLTIVPSRAIGVRDGIVADGIVADAIISDVPTILLDGIIDADRRPRVVLPLRPAFAFALTKKSKPG
jgi:hypothetical protein